MKIYWLEQTEADLPKLLASASATASATDDWPVPVAAVSDRRRRSEIDATARGDAPPAVGHGQDGYATPHGRDGSSTKPELEWLSARELLQLEAFRIEKRRADWMLGRWTAKHAVAACLCLPADFPSLAKIELRPSSSGAPEVFLSNKWAPATISLSHRAGRAVCAVAPSRGALGCDLEIVEPHSDAFIDDYFAREEQGLVAQAAPEDRAWLITLLWSAKESALKALHAGLKLDTRCVIVTPVNAPRRTDSDEGEDAPEEQAVQASFAARPSGPGDGWRPLRVRHVNAQTLLGWWQHTGQTVRTLVAAPPPARPLQLDMPRRTAASPSAASAQRAQAA